MHPIEEAVIQAFIAPSRRSRWLWMLESAKQRDLDTLNHCADLDPRYARFLPSNADVLGLLQSHGAPPDCYLLSAADELDGRLMMLTEAVPAVERCGWGTIISCIAGQLAYYHDESGERRALLVRDRAMDTRPAQGQP